MAPITPGDVVNESTPMSTVLLAFHSIAREDEVEEKVGRRGARPESARRAKSIIQGRFECGMSLNKRERVGRVAGVPCVLPGAP